jgi:hypothetical protein
MRRLNIILLTLYTASSLYSQNIYDALRYSNDNIEGSARFSAMGGAFGALGGDISAISINPASSAVFNNNIISMSLSNTSIENKANINNNSIQKNETKKSNFNLNNLGGTFIFNNVNTNSKLNKLAISITYAQTSNNFDKFRSEGVNSNSIDSYFLDYAQGLRLDEISAFDGETTTQAYSEIGNAYGYGNQQAFLGYESYIIEPNSFNNDNTSYYSNISDSDTGYDQSYYFKSRGYSGKLSANIAYQYSNNIYFGVNLNSHFIDYDHTTYLNELNLNENSIISEIGFQNTLSTLGDGFSLQIGAITKVNEVIRLGFTYDSPVWYNISEETTQSVGTLRNFESDSNPGEILSETIIVNPNVINVFEDYKLKIPSKITASAAFVFKKTGLLSFDYSIKDYSKMIFKPKNDTHFIQQNQVISNSLNQSSSFRIGAEILNDRFSYRAGYRFQESPMRINNNDLKGISFGIGYKFGNSNIDFSIENYSFKKDHQMYDAGQLGNINLNKSNSIVKLSLTSTL